MKKIITLLLALSLCAAFALPAFAEETKTAEDYYNEAQQLNLEMKYEEAALAYVKAAELYQEGGDSEEAKNAYQQAGTAYDKAAEAYKTAGDFAAAAEAYMKAGKYTVKAGNWAGAAGMYDKAASVYYNELVDFAAAGDAKMIAGACNAKAGNLNQAAIMFGSAALKYNDIGDTELAELMKQLAKNTDGFAEFDEGSCAAKDYYKAMGLLAEAAMYRQLGYDQSANEVLTDINMIFRGLIPGAEKMAFGMFGGSTLSEGSLTIIVGVAAAIVFGLGGFLLGTAKKKKPAKESEE